MKYNLVNIGHWALVFGLVLAISAGFATIPFLAAVLFILGLIIGFLNVTEKESTPFLVAVIAFLLIGVAGLQLEQSIPLISSILNNLIALMSAAGLVVAIKQVLSIAKKDE